MCIFCSICDGSIPSYKVYEDDYVIAFLDLSQTTKGHTLVVPKKHFDSILDVEANYLHKMMDAVNLLTNRYKERLGCVGFNIINNCGERAGQSVMHVHIHIIPRYKDDDFSINFPGRFTIEVFYGIIAPYLIDATVERALWLDADIIIKDDIGDFYHMDFGGKSLVVCRDECEDHPMEVKKWKQRLNICDSHIYFNAGVMLMDFQRIRSKFTLEEVITTCNAYKDRILMLNQDIMNVLFENDVIYVNSKEFNISPLCYRKDFLEGYEDVKIIHYFATPKPWKLFIGVDPKLDYWKIQKQRGRLLQYYIAVGIRFLKLDNVFRFCWNKVRKIKRKIRGKLK